MQTLGTLLADPCPRVPNLVIAARVWVRPENSDPLTHIVTNRELVLTAALVGSAALVAPSDLDGQLALRKTLLRAMTQIDQKSYHASVFDCTHWVERWRGAGLPVGEPPAVFVLEKTRDPATLH